MSEIKKCAHCGRKFEDEILPPVRLRVGYGDHDYRGDHVFIEDRVFGPVTVDLCPSCWPLAPKE